MTDHGTRQLAGKLSEVVDFDVVGAVLFSCRTVDTYMHTSMYTSFVVLMLIFDWSDLFFSWSKCVCKYFVLFLRVSKLDGACVMTCVCVCVCACARVFMRIYVYFVIVTGCWVVVGCV